MNNIKRLANPKWIKYTQCKNCSMCFNIDIASEPCLRCGGHDFTQFDLILYKMKKNRIK